MTPVRPTALPERRLGSSGVTVSALSLGAAALGNLYSPVSDADADATVRTAWELGMRYVDTAPHYGLGRSEERVGRALRGLPRSSFTLSTKAGRRLRPLGPGERADPQGFADPPPRQRFWDFGADGVRASVEESLERLGLDRIDVVYLHDPDGHEEQAYATAFPALAELRSQGVVGAIGAGMNQTPMLARFVRDLDLDVVLCAGRYTLLDQSALTELFPACERRGTSVVIGGVYNSGLLADPSPASTFDYGPAPEPLVRRAREMARVCARHGVPLRAAALRFAAAHPVVASVLVGCRTAEEARDNRRLWDQEIPDGLWDELGVPAPPEASARTGGGER
ncbi:aldo/keto reductase [Actinorugispora endophytica]|uniref:D-threo-aldose 1-dehydrogenase n=1 Tax=Actinorugispora endophytica TaxID=1605990 RepID=A0A4R6UKB7_9ACTN|nr:aldo/keto reductase [Actinorugispora endophytica]TDQ46576.1 D-threo-aldose 1-dehydrogenase [Actinorugispora endophytica]